MGFFTPTECRHCGGKNHASDDCPHHRGFLGLGGETACRHCSSKDHASDECPHFRGILGLGGETACRHCSSKDHASDECPHYRGILGLGGETACTHCGSKNHASDKCPHYRGILGLGGETACRHCSSKDHASDECPHHRGLLGLGGKSECIHCGSSNHLADECPQLSVQRGDDSTESALVEWLVKMALWVGGILFALWLALMALIVTVVLSPVWLGAVVIGALVGFCLGNRTANQMSAEDLSQVPVEERQKGKNQRMGIEEVWVRTACRLSPHVLLMVLGTAIYVLALTLWPLRMSPDEWTRIALWVAGGAGIILGTWAGRSVFCWQYEHRLLRRLLPENVSITGSAGALTGFGVTAMLALVGVWFTAMVETGGRWNLFSGSQAQVVDLGSLSPLSSSSRPVASGLSSEGGDTLVPRVTRREPPLLGGGEPERRVAMALSVPKTMASPQAASTEMSMKSVPKTMGMLNADGKPQWPDGFSVYDPSISPDKAYGVLVPNQKTFQPGSKGQNKLVDLKTGKVLAVIDAESWFYDASVAMNQFKAEPRWSRDGKALAWIVSGKWGPQVFEVLILSNDEVEWQTHVLPVAHESILQRTREAVPELYAAAKLENQGNGSAYPDGFTVVMGQPEEGFTLPLHCLVTLDSNPKNIEGRTNLFSSLMLRLDGVGDLHVSEFGVRRANAATRSGDVPPVMATPAPAGPVVPEHVREFVRHRVRTESSRDLDSILQNYAEQVTYWDHGLVGHDVIRKDKSSYFQRWPVSREELQEPIKAGPDGPGDDWKAVFRTRFRVENPQTGIAIDGLQETLLTVRYRNGVFKIVSEAGEVLEKQREEKSMSTTTKPAGEKGTYPGERFPETRRQTLTSATLGKMNPDELRYAINEMFARYGADFEKSDLKKHFSQFSWYQAQPGLTFDEIEHSLFTPLEKDNLKRLAEVRIGTRKPQSAKDARQAPASSREMSSEEFLRKAKALQKR